MQCIAIFLYGCRATQLSVRMAISCMLGLAGAAAVVPTLVEGLFRFLHTMVTSGTPFHILTANWLLICLKMVVRLDCGTCSMTQHMGMAMLCMHAMNATSDLTVCTSYVTCQNIYALQ